MTNAIICDTSVWLYLGFLEQCGLLHQLYEAVYTTEAVCRELDNGRINRPHIFDPRQVPQVHVVQTDLSDISGLPANRLGFGERSVLAYARRHQVKIVGLDDRQARELAQQMNLQVVGTVGLLLRAKQAGLIKVVRPLLFQLQAEGFRIDLELLEYALQKAKEM